MGLIDCPKKSLHNYPYMLHNIAEQQRLHIMHNIFIPLANVISIKTNIRPWQKALIVYNLAITLFQDVQVCFIRLALSTALHAITSKYMVTFILTAVNISKISITVLNCFHLVNTILLQILFYIHGSSENFSQTQVMTNPFPIELHFTVVYTPFLRSGRIQ